MRFRQKSKPVNLTLTVDSAVTVTTSSLGRGTFGEAYSLTLRASGGTGVLHLYSTGLPKGLSLNGNVISGTPGAAGAFSVTITATDSRGGIGTKDYYPNGESSGHHRDNVLASKGELWAALPRCDVTASGGSGSYKFTQTGLPNGLRLDENGRNLWHADTSGNLHRYHHREGHHLLEIRWSFHGNEAP